MRASSCVIIEAQDAVRARLLVREYGHFIADPALLAARLAALATLHGKARIEEWMALAQAGQWPEFVTALLREHYDPAYDRSIRRNFARVDEAPRVVLPGADDAALGVAAAELAALGETLRGD
jgi:tRNA 2-selenouridine synthase